MVGTQSDRHGATRLGGSGPTGSVPAVVVFATDDSGKARSPTLPDETCPRFTHTDYATSESKIPIPLRQET